MELTDRIGIAITANGPVGIGEIVKTQRFQATSVPAGHRLRAGDGIESCSAATMPQRAFIGGRWWQGGGMTRPPAGLSGVDQLAAMARPSS